MLYKADSNQLIHFSMFSLRWNTETQGREGCIDVKKERINKSGISSERAIERVYLYCTD
jgi:hypothetical protein